MTSRRAHAALALSSPSPAVRRRCRCRVRVGQGTFDAEQRRKPSRIGPWLGRPCPHERRAAGVTSADGARKPRARRCEDGGPAPSSALSDVLASRACRLEEVCRSSMQRHPAVAASVRGGAMGGSACSAVSPPACGARSARPRIAVLSGSEWRRRCGLCRRCRSVLVLMLTCAKRDACSAARRRAHIFPAAARCGARGDVWARRVASSGPRCSAQGHFISLLCAPRSV
ncbi:hypothetical protein FA09DRAFT_60594 [Tilletiopsis washingtonensis]|uniref:Uncharacterized protein n=1 Tax=Tilletiopsis washingtonensis TaxID=58919 RepID=A0A316Z5P1_9BASI|nr:hypothetical protein FA09DRAFT_60594 [Tilletiopsis washingtonensis]PWN97100.1 hypothetical protein FA09DRAFT_60594 [Tilletiopsis washingtonensis]